MEAKVIFTTPLELKAIIADAVAAAFEYQKSFPAHVQADDGEKPLNIKETALFLGIAEQTIYQNINRIPHKKRFGRLYFFRSELLTYLNSEDDFIQAVKVDTKKETIREGVTPSKKDVNKKANEFLIKQKKSISTYNNR